MDIDDSSDSSSNEQRAVRKKVKTYNQKYISKWEQQHKGWLASSTKGKNYFHCKACGCHCRAGKTEVEKHAKGKKHLERVRDIANQQTLLNMPSISGENRQAENVKAAEIRLPSFVVEHNIPFTVMDHLPKLVKAVCPDSEIVQNVMGKVSSDKLIETLKVRNFSLLVDESTDIGGTKHLALITRVVDEDLKVKDEFFALVPIHDATANNMYDNIKNIFQDLSIPYKENMIGFASDGANSMMGAKHSLSTLLKRDIPHLFVMKCICHSFALCASYACKKLPGEVEGLARETYNHFSNSPKRVGNYKEFQEFVSIKPHKLLQPYQIRWLSLLIVVQRLLEQLPALKLYFINEAIAENVPGTESILSKINNPINTLYLMFLEYILPYFNDLNKEIQSEHPKLYKLHDKVSQVYRSLLECYIKEEYLERTDLEKVQYRDPANFMKIEKIYLGGKVTAAITTGKYNLKGPDLLLFRQRCLDFLIEGAHQIYTRFPLSKLAHLKQLIAMNPTMVVNKSVPSIAPLAALYPAFVEPSALNDLDREWRLLRNTDTNKNL